MEEVTGTVKDYVYEKVVNFLKKEEDHLKLSKKASIEMDLDTSWTRKALVMGMTIHASLNDPLYCEESTAPGRKGEAVYVIKRAINEKPRWIRFRLAQDQYGDDAALFIISAHEDK